MILRVLRAAIRAGHEAELAHFIRDRAMADVLKIPGLQSWQPATRSAGDGVELVLVSTWTTIEALLATRRDLNTPVAAPTLDDLVHRGSAEHYELVVGGARGIPIPRGSLRVVRARLKPNTGSAYFDAIRPAADALLDEQALAAVHVGRRLELGLDEALTVSLWTGEMGSLGEDAARDMLEGAPEVEVYEAISIVEHPADAPAILLADDERRYVYATRAAADLVGRSVPRLLTMRVDDIAAPELRPSVSRMWNEFLERGQADGPFTLARPDGTEVEIRFSARARYPWPGCHASMLSAMDEAEPDIEAALAAAGVVSRQPMPL